MESTPVRTFSVTLRQLVVPAGVSEAYLPARAAHKLGIPAEDIVSCTPLRRALDARKRRARPVYVYHLRLEIAYKHRHALRKNHDLDLVWDQGVRQRRAAQADPAPDSARPRPVVVGAGPAGLFAALRLARAGWQPIILERGQDGDMRRRAAAEFWRHGTLDPESNVLFGLGGAGLFSDGKLNTRHKDRAGMAEILDILVAAGAPASIRIDAAPHAGSDLLDDIVARIADEIRSLGGEWRFGTRLTGLTVQDGRLQAVQAQCGGQTDSWAADTLVLATGHSARDVYGLVLDAGLHVLAKPFAIGVRVELPQDQVDASQRGGSFDPGPGEAASFRLSRAPVGTERACYTFCMCPGGQVIACASEPGRLCVNGMSWHARAGAWANAAFLVPVSEADYAADGSGPLAGIAFQRRWEEAAYRAGLAGGPYCVPAQTLRSFAAGAAPDLPDARGVGRAAPADLHACLPAYAAGTLAQAIPAMLGRLRKADPDAVLLYGVETRTSSPARIERDKHGAAPGAAGVYPAGEGSGYAGGIMTSALDGWRAAGALMRRA